MMKQASPRTERQRNSQGAEHKSHYMSKTDPLREQVLNLLLALKWADTVDVAKTKRSELFALVGFSNRERGFVRSNDPSVEIAC